MIKNYRTWFLSLLAGVLALCLIAKASKPETRIGLRVDRVQKGLVFLKPIYPMKLGGTLEKGAIPEDDQLLTCTVTEESEEMVNKQGVPVTLRKMVLHCLTGQEITVIGIEY